MARKIITNSRGYMSTRKKERRIARDNRRTQRKNRRDNRANDRALKVSKYRARRDYVSIRNEKLSSFVSVLKIILLLFFSTILISFLSVEEGETIRYPSFTTLLNELQNFTVIPMIDLKSLNNNFLSVGAFLVNGVSQTINFILFFIRWIFA